MITVKVNAAAAKLKRTKGNEKWEKLYMTEMK